jgi:hypothetical protein
VEAEWASYKRLGGYPSPAGPYDTNDGGFILGSFLFPSTSGAGRFEILGKWGIATFSGVLPEDEEQTTTEINLNYLLRQFNARVMMFFQDTRFELTEEANSRRVGAGLQIQM